MDFKLSFFLIIICCNHCKENSQQFVNKTFHYNVNNNKTQIFNVQKGRNLRGGWSIEHIIILMSAKPSQINKL